MKPGMAPGERVATMTDTPCDLLPLVLVVDDEVIIAEIVSESLAEGGFEVIVAHDGDTAASIINDPTKKLIALVTDIRLPTGPDGWSLGAAAREVNPLLPVVYMSGDSSCDWPAKGVPNSIVLAKPFAPAQVAVGVASLLNTVGPKPAE